MEKSFYSSSWYRVADLKPWLLSHARIHRQHFRGQLWYVLQDQASGRHHRFSPAAYFVISMMDGERTVRQIWEAACKRLGDDALTQDEMIQLLAQLHQSDVLHADVPPSVEEMSERAAKMRRRRIAMSVLNPLALRVPLFDPDVFLATTLPVVRPLFSWLGALVVFGIIAYAAVLAGEHWSALTRNITDRIFVAKNLMLLLVTYPFVKACHEMGHGYALKRWGGEVHELGVMFLVFMPVPYVDASASAAFHEKWRRALVGAAGIIVELLLASFALFVWLEAQEGVVRAFAFNVMLIGGISTILFNGNPLLRFDGYYVLSDVLEIPNLADRTRRYFVFLILRYLFGVKDAVTPVTAPREPGWLIFYGLASLTYRIFIIAAIVLVVAGKFFIIGVLIAVWSTVMMLGVPLGKAAWFLLTSPQLNRQRGRAFAMTGVALFVLIGGLTLIPVPYRTVAEGIVWSPGETAVIPNTGGTVVGFLAQPGSAVVKGEPLIRLKDALLTARVGVLEAAVRELRLRREAVYATDPLKEELVTEELKRTEGELAVVQRRQHDLVVRSPRAGRFVVKRAPDLIGKFVHQGELLGIVADFRRPIAVVVVPEDDADLVRDNTRSVAVRLAEHLGVVHRARILREVPNINDSLPSPALSTLGGGNIVVDPRDPNSLKSLTDVLHLELAFDKPFPVDAMGGRVYARFDHGDASLAWQGYLFFRQLFLRRFHV